MSEEKKSYAEILKQAAKNKKSNSVQNKQQDQSGKGVKGNKGFGGATVVRRSGRGG